MAICLKIFNTKLSEIFTFNWHFHHKSHAVAILLLIAPIDFWQSFCAVAFFTIRNGDFRRWSQKLR